MPGGHTVTVEEHAFDDHEGIPRRHAENIAVAAGMQPVRRSRQVETVTLGSERFQYALAQRCVVVGVQPEPLRC